MGGIDSGRRYAANEAKATVENQISINILDLKKRGCLESGTISSRIYSINSREIGWIFISAEEDMLSLDYRFNRQFRQQKIQITSTPANYGGRRKYLVCPQCHSKRAMLYHGKNGKFGCRSCHGFVYRSTQLNPHLRAEHMAQKITEKLGGTDFIFDRKKPFRMWDKTFFRLQDKFIIHRQKSCDLFIDYVDKIFEKYGSVMGKEKEKSFV